MHVNTKVDITPRQISNVLFDEAWQGLAEHIFFVTPNSATPSFPRYDLPPFDAHFDPAVHNKFLARSNSAGL
jgi:hypothetical protein